jgi:hypothetical protein
MQVPTTNSKKSLSGLNGLTKKNEIHETKPEKITKRNEILLLTKQTKRNETKFRCLFCFAKQAKQFCVSLCFVFRETKKRMRNGNPNVVITVEICAHWENLAFLVYLCISVVSCLYIDYPLRCINGFVPLYRAFIYK